MNKEFCLSENRYPTEKEEFVYDEEDVKEFIRRLKERVNDMNRFAFIKEIDKLAGDKLI